MYAKNCTVIHCMYLKKNYISYKQLQQLHMMVITTIVHMHIFPIFSFLAKMLSFLTFLPEMKIHIGKICKQTITWTTFSNIKIHWEIFSNLPSQNIWTLSRWLSFDKEPEPLAASESQMQANVSSERISSWCLLSSLVSSRSRCSDRWHVKVIHPKYFKHLYIKKNLKS